MVFNDQIPLKASGANPDKRHAVAMSFIHVCLEFEDIAAKRGLYRIDLDLCAVGKIGEAAVGTGG